MKIFKPFIVFLLATCVHSVSAQTLNWSNLKKNQKHIANIHAGAEHGLIYGVTYGYHVKAARPIVLTAGYSFPAGKRLTDDFKTKIGGQINWHRSGNFYLSSQLQGVFRKFGNSYVRLLNFGADVSTTGGYYKKHWFAAGEVGFDKAIVTHFKHSDLYKANFPGVKDGWYEPSTGGNFYYGLLGGYSFKQTDLYLKAGKLVEQDFKTLPTIPIYAELGVNFKLKKTK
jgi:hypothetical protein